MQPQLSTGYNSIVLFQNKKYSIEKYIHWLTKRWAICLIIDSVHTESVMIYENNSIGFTNPYGIPEYIKVKVRRFAQTLNKDIQVQESDTTKAK